jgi:hypothetical protein
MNSLSVLLLLQLSLFIFILLMHKFSQEFGLLVMHYVILASQSSLGTRGTPQVSGNTCVSSGEPAPPRPYHSGEYLSSSFE